MNSSSNEENSIPPQDVFNPRLKKVRFLFQNLNLRAERLLDIGCYDGTFTASLKEFANELYGIDIADKAVEFAKKNGIKAFQLDVDKKDLPFEDKFFDIIFCGELIEHVLNPDHLFDEMHRVLKPGGIAIVTTPNLASYANRLVLLFGFQPYQTSTGLRYSTGKFLSKRDIAPFGHLRLFTCRGLKELLQLHRFCIKRTFGSGASQMRYPLPLLLRFLDRILSSIPQLANYLIFIVEKK